LLFALSVTHVEFGYGSCIKIFYVGPDPGKIASDVYGKVVGSGSTRAVKFVDLEPGSICDRI
jgi:hypothetical protein